MQLVKRRCTRALDWPQGANDNVYVPPLPADLPELRNRIEAIVATITPHTLIKVWEELAYRLDVCRVTKGVHIEYL